MFLNYTTLISVTELSFILSEQFSLICSIPLLAVQQKNMQMWPPSKLENQLSPDPASLAEDPITGLPAILTQCSELYTDCAWSWGFAGFYLLLC